MQKGLYLLLLATALMLLTKLSFAGDEDKRAETPELERIVIETPEIPPPPPEPEPDVSIGEETLLEQEPEIVPEVPKVQSKPTPPRIQNIDADNNMNYSEILSSIELESLPAEVRAPALGRRGYRPNLVAVGTGDRIPGYGFFMEYCWNRIGAGVSYSYRPLEPEDTRAKSQSFLNIYSYYQWLPFSITPYFLVGIEKAMPSEQSIGGMAGVGMEAQIYRGWTMLLGYTYHSAVHKGFMGGSFGWAF